MFRKFLKNKRIFLDSAAGSNNPSAIYDEGVVAKKKLEEARVKVARIVRAQAQDIIFTSGGTEADNLAILGMFAPKAHLVIAEHEHPAVSESAKEFARRGGELTIANVENIPAVIKNNTVVVSVAYANGETGGINPISKIAHELKNVPLHSDASQAAGLLSLDVSTLGVSLLTLDGRKLGVPGVGVLVVRPGVALKPIMFGGGQERGLRPGTENVDAIIKFAETLEQAEARRKSTVARLEQLQKYFLQTLTTVIPDAVINTPKHSLPNIVSVSFPGQLHEFLAIKLNERGVCVSTGSACKSGRKVDEGEALRFSFHAETGQKDLAEAIRILKLILL